MRWICELYEQILVPTNGAVGRKINLSALKHTAKYLKRFAYDIYVYMCEKGSC
jgi:hypothetical protein